MQDNHEVFMQRCIELAKLGEENVSPNPMVGAVLVYKNKIIGEGFHKNFGEAHAEVNAIKSVCEKELISKSTLYVSLEPCSHFGKTPPCSDLIVENNIKKVVIGCRDIFSLVNGKGIEHLKNAGVDVIEGVLEAECKELNKIFFSFHKKKRPFITLKWAETKDAYIGKNKIPNFKISNDLSNILAHKLRCKNMAIVVGTNTALIDNPKLNSRKWYGKSPIRIVFDFDGKLNSTLNIFSMDENYLVITSQKSEINFPNKNIVRINDTKNPFPELMSYLFNKGINSILVEGGAKLLQSFIDTDLWDEAIQIKSENFSGDGIKAPILNYRKYAINKVGSDTHYLYKNTN
jgi:diaminohydroxyphosphoribosylaminopyrimidine deaminase / 5-amino-6-(5-phosphoribosylamino)uracil reductase